LTDVVTIHPLAELIGRCADGAFPQPDGGWHRVRPWRPGVEAVLAFTGHAVLAVGDDVSDRRLDGLGVDGIGGAHHPRVLVDLAGPDGWIDSLDALLVRRAGPRSDAGADPEPLVPRPDLADHSRAHWARAVRDEVSVWGYPDRSRSSVATLSSGIGGLTELSVELEADERGRHRGRDFVAAAVAAAHRGDLVAAAVAPGNAASLRAFLAAGFAVIGSVQLLRPART
jgi:hypothetical protein